MAAGAPPSLPLFTRIRIATKSDITNIHKLTQQLAAHHQLQTPCGPCSPTEESLSADLFNSEPFESTTVFLLEVSESEFSSSNFTPIIKTLTLTTPIFDPDKSEFKTSENDVVVAGFAIFYFNYSTFLAKRGFYLDGLYVRECYRNCGMGKMLLSAVAAKAAELGLGRVEWMVVHSNVNAIRFYESMGAEVMPLLRICRLTGKALDSYGSDGEPETETIM